MAESELFRAQVYQDALTILQALEPIKPDHEMIVTVACRVLIAERTRCAKIVEQGLGRTNTSIAMTIRSGESAK